jgi:hypothetical protein
VKVEFLDGAYTRARLTRGWLWWRRVAYVRAYGDQSIACPRGLCSDPEHPRWEYELSGRDLEGGRNHRVRVAQILARLAIAAPALEEWRRPDEIPRARALPLTLKETP